MLLSSTSSWGLALLPPTHLPIPAATWGPRDTVQGRWPVALPLCRRQGDPEPGSPSGAQPPIGTVSRRRCVHSLSHPQAGPHGARGPAAFDHSPQRVHPEFLLL